MANDTSRNKASKKSQPAKEDSEDEFLVVGLGASAGGIHALKEFFTRVPKDSGMAYVVILHMSPAHESKLAEILQVTSSIPVTQVKKREKIEPDHVYVIPPNQNLAMTDGHLTLAEMIGVAERRSPVDLFFRTLAETNESLAVSVILSGTGANGSIGIKRVKEQGGVAFVQDPNEAEYADMPRNAIATGMVDYVLPVAEIPSKIISYRQHRGALQIPEQPEPTPKTDEQALTDIFTQLRMRTGQDFSNYKRATILRRIDRRLGLTEQRGLADYARYMREVPKEVHALMKDLLISVTNFFRDPESIEVLASKVIPKIYENKNPDDQVRVWVAGCATGEEAYSIAMLLYEYAARAGRLPNLQIFATDLDEQAIQTAREGFYRVAELVDVSRERVSRFFAPEAEGYRVRHELRELILFAVHNIIKDPPFSHLDLVSCRNLLIYLNRTAQKRLLEVAHFALNPTGYLFLGASEAVDGAGDLFNTIDKNHHIFQSKPVPPRAFPVPEVKPKPILATKLEPEKTQKKHAIQRLSYADLHLRLLESYAPPSVVVNEDYDIVHLSERAGRYLQMTGGEPSHNLLKTVRPELRLELRTALYQAINDRVNVDVRDLKVESDTGCHTVNILVRPVLGDEDLTRGFILVMFEEGKQIEGPRLDEPIVRSTEPIARRLEEELEHARSQLRATVEQYEIQQEELRASNEELQAMNEELRSAAEELETSKEELQSINEELTTVNQELKTKIEELTQANNNFSNLMNSTNIGTIFLDRRLRVRLFTPSAQDTFNLRPGDVGRPLMDITTQLRQTDLPGDVENVLTSLQSVEREVKTLDNRSYMMRISPYRTSDDKIDGVVVTMVDVTDRAHVKEELRLAGEQLEARVVERTGELAEANVALRVEMAERRRAEEGRKELFAQLVKTQEDERRRFALDLHDQLGQQITALRLKLETLKNKSNTSKEMKNAFGELQVIVKQLDDDVDFMAWELRPVALDDFGLSSALSNYVKQWSEHFGIPAEFSAGDLENERFDPRVETTLYRIAQEALNNCAKHSRCTRADVLIERRDHNAILIVEDNGIGFDPLAQLEGDRQLGLIGIRERAAMQGGTVEIESGPGKGTSIFVRVPLAGGAGRRVGTRKDNSEKLLDHVGLDQEEDITDS